MMYLDFVTEVTNDILVRGIFTNRVLRNVFEEHVEKNKGRLDEVRSAIVLQRYCHHTVTVLSSHCHGVM